MQLKVDGQPRLLQPLQEFRAARQLPANFGVDYFEAKDWEGLGSIDGSGPHLQRLRQRLLEEVPQAVTIAQLPTMAERLTAIFKRELLGINPTVGLRLPEIDFAVAGFYDVLDAVAYRLVQLHYSPADDSRLLCERFVFAEVYQQWLDNSVRVATVKHSYQHIDQLFTVQVIYNAYGRVGLRVAIEDAKEGCYYLLDQSLACPAASFMKELCAQVSRALCQAVQSDGVT